MWVFQATPPNSFMSISFSWSPPASSAGASAGSAAAGDIAPPSKAARSRPPAGASSAYCSGSAAGAYPDIKAFNADMSIPCGNYGYAGAAAVAARPSRLMSSSGVSSTTFFAFFYAFGAKGLSFKSIALFNVFTAFSIIGSTSWSIPNLRSKSWTAGIILLRLYIFEKTLTSGWVSSNLFKIFDVNAFWILWTAFFFAWAAYAAGFFLASITDICFFKRSIIYWLSDATFVYAFVAALALAYALTYALTAASNFAYD